MKRKELDLTCAIWAQERHNKIAEAKAEVRRAENRKSKRNDAIITMLMAAFVIGGYLYIVLDTFNVLSLLTM